MKTPTRYAVRRTKNNCWKGKPLAICETVQEAFAFQATLGANSGTGVCRWK